MMPLAFESSNNYEGIQKVLLTSYYSHVMLTTWIFMSKHKSCTKSTIMLHLIWLSISTVHIHPRLYPINTQVIDHASGC
jgi:hypothetical protein